ncbi:hypothetical protein ECG_03810 [Echinococcus granulosus]|nr:hypothetical protein ECG_03810 [Echinococcus granulosus]
MSLHTQSLPHYSDFDGTSESETSELSIVLPYGSRFRGKKHSQPSEGQIRQKKGARAIRRYENDAYLSTLAMITEATGEDEIDNYWIDRTTKDTGFKCLFVDADIREIWDAFISLSETKQIELLGNLSSQSAFGDDDDVDMGDDVVTHPPPKNYNNASGNNNSSRQRRGNKGRPRRRPVVHLEPIFEDPLETSVEAFEALRDMVDIVTPFDGSRIPSVTDLPFPQDVGSDDAAFPTPGSISPKLLEFIRNVVKQQQRQQDSGGSDAGTKGGRKKQRRFCVQDLCLIHRVEAELRAAFGAVESSVRVWTPSTSLLRSSIPSNENQQGRMWVRGSPLALSGFQRMLVHATANYLGLHSFSTWDGPLSERKLWVDRRSAEFRPPTQPLLAVIRSTIEGMLSEKS